MNITSKEAKRFVKYISKMEFLEFIGMARMLCVPVVHDNDYDKPRDFEEVFSEMYDRFIQLEPKVRNDILDFMKKATKGSENNGTST